MTAFQIRISIGAFVFCLIMGAGYWFATSLPKIYSASAVIRVIPPGDAEKITTPEQMKFIQRQFDLIRSDARIAELVEKLDLRSQIADEINARPSLLNDDQLMQFIKQSRLKFKPYTSSDLMLIKALSQSPEKALAMAQVLAEMHVQNSAPGSVELYGQPKAASRPEKPNIGMMMMGSALLGVILALCIAAGTPIPVKQS